MKGRKKLILLISLIIAVTSAIFFYKNEKATAPDSSAGNQASFVEAPKQTDGSFKTFTGEEFARLYDAFAYPNTQLINERSPITGHELADMRIRQLAVAKGYKLRSAPVSNAFVEVQKGMLLQRPAAQPWLDMQKTAKDQGISMSLFDAFRSAEDQRTIFLDRLKGISLDSIANKLADAQVNTVLGKTALPGYSRHHTGYTIDISCDSQPNVKFEASSCFAWLSKDNYLNAKTYGWIPSYPDGAANQGPEPESWEYVWVGTDSLRE